MIITKIRTITQETNINFTLTVEADDEQTKNDSGNFVRRILTSAENSKTLSLHKYQINEIKEEVEI